MKELFMFPEVPTSIHGFGRFEEWWACYPHKACKGQARAAWKKALTKATFEDMREAVGRYKATKPDDIPWCNPATWLNGERWLDQPADPAANRRTMSEEVAELRLIKSHAELMIRGRNV